MTGFGIPLAASVLILSAGGSNANAATTKASINAAGVSDPTATAALQYTEDQTNTTEVASLRRELIGGAATLDGHPITDVKLVTRCQTVFTTKSNATVTVHWNKVGNFAATVDRGSATIPIDDGAGVHNFVLPEGDGFRRVNGTVGHLADACEYHTQHK